MQNLKYYFKKAQKERWAVPQFNFSDYTQLKGIANKCSQMRSPFILGTSEGESGFFGLQEAVALRNTLRNKLHTPIFLNLDHGKSFDYIKTAIDAGYDMVHFDGSKLPVEENIKITRQIKKYAKQKQGLFSGRNVLVEGEMGKIGTDSSKVYEGKFEIKEEDLTLPGDAQKFVEETRVDLLAVSIGNFHGIESSGINPALRIDVLKSINEATGTILVLHGGSGIPENNIKEAIKFGIVKININTELRLAFSNKLRSELSTDEIVPYKYLAEPQKEVEKIVEAKINLFGSANRV
jgi:fructose-bisphosphate aldolase class II